MRLVHAAAIDAAGSNATSFVGHTSLNHFDKLSAADGLSCAMVNQIPSRSLRESTVCLTSAIVFFISEVPVHESRVTSVQTGVDLRRCYEGASVDQTEARKLCRRRSQNAVVSWFGKGHGDCTEVKRFWRIE